MYCWMFELCFRYSRRNDILSFAMELKMTNLRAFMVEKYSLSNNSTVCFVQIAKLEYLSEIWSCLCNTKG